VLCIEGDKVIHVVADLMYANVSCTVMQRAVHVHPTVSELLPRLSVMLKPLERRMTCSSASAGVEEFWGIGASSTDQSARSMAGHEALWRSWASICASCRSACASPHSLAVSSLSRPRVSTSVA
jgi:hypothetical protein